MWIHAFPDIKQQKIDSLSQYNVEIGIFHSGKTNNRH